MGKKNLVFIAPKEDFNLLLAILNRYIYVFHWNTFISHLRKENMHGTIYCR